MLLLDQSPRRGNADFGLAGIVGIEELDGPSQHAAGLVDPVNRQLCAVLLGLSPVGERSAQDCGDADPHGLGGVRGPHAYEPGENNGCAACHDGSLNETWLAS